MDVERKPWPQQWHRWRVNFETGAVTVDGEPLYSGPGWAEYIDRGLLLDSAAHKWT